MIKVRTHINNRKLDPVLGHEHRPVVDGREKNTSFSCSSTVYNGTEPLNNHRRLSDLREQCDFQMCLEVA